MVRSLVPREKKSQASASASAASAAPGVSIMTPSGGASAIGTRARVSLRIILSTAFRTCLISSTEVIIGTRMRTGPWAPARRIAAICASSSAGILSERRTARSPSAGLTLGEMCSPRE